MLSPGETAESAGPAAERFSARQLELLDGLERIVLEDRFGELGVGEIARRLSCSRSTLYAIARSKDELFDVVVERVLDRIATAARDACGRQTNPTDRLEAYLAGALDAIRAIDGPLIAEMQRHAGARTRLAAFQRTVIGEIEALIRSGVDAGDFHPVNTALAAELLDAVVSRIRQRHVLKESGLSASDALADAFRVITRGLLK